MASGTGLGADVLFGPETTWGTLVTPTRCPEIISETINLDKTFLQGFGLRGGGSFPRASRNKEVRRMVSGGVVMDLPTRGLGVLLQNLLGSAGTAPVVVTGTAYKQIHQVGFTDGLGMTWQVQRPQTDGTVKPFTYFGLKVIGWELTVAEGQIVSLSVTFDGKDGNTSTALATYTPVVGTEVFSFTDATVLNLGGTATTTTGVVSIATGVPIVSIVKDFKLAFTRGTANQRFGVGFGGVKAQQIMNAWGSATITLTSEFTSQAEFYDRYTAGTVIPLQLTMIGSQIAATGSYHTFDIVVPAAKVTAAPVNVSGPDIIPMNATLEILDDGTNSPLQVTMISEDAAL